MELYHRRFIFGTVTAGRRLYDIVSDFMLSGSSYQSATLFTGVPGIGKSLFLIYLIFRFLDDLRFPEKRFVTDFNRGEYKLFVPTVSVANFNAAPRPVTVYLFAMPWCWLIFPSQWSQKVMMIN
jgi:hypothetical protein